MNIIIRKIVVFEDENECFVIVFFTRRLFLNNYINYIFNALNEFRIQIRENKECQGEWFIGICKLFLNIFGILKYRWVAGFPGNNFSVN